MPSYNESEASKVSADLPPIIDAHVHISPRGILSAIRNWFDEHAWRHIETSQPGPFDSIKLSKWPKNS